MRKVFQGYMALELEICNIIVTVHTGIQERGDEDCDKRGI